MAKSFKIARKPAQGNGGGEATPAAQRKRRSTKPLSSVAMALTPDNLGPTTRKTIEVPEGYFFQVKMRALERHMKEKELWAEIVSEYFEHHPTV